MLPVCNKSEDSTEDCVGRNVDACWFCTIIDDASVLQITVGH